MDEALLRIPHSEGFIHPASIRYEADHNNSFFMRVLAVLPPVAGAREPEWVVFGAQNGRRVYGPSSSGRSRWDGREEHCGLNTEHRIRNRYNAPMAGSRIVHPVRSVEYQTDGTRLMTDAEDAAFVEAMRALRAANSDSERE